MQYAFLIVAAAWMVQFTLSYWQLRRFHRQLANMRKLGRCAIGLSGNHWRGRTYGVLVLDEHDRVSHAALFSGWTVFSKLQPISRLDGMRLDAFLTTDQPVGDLRQQQWQAFQHAAQFFKTHPTSSHSSTQPVMSN